MDAILTLPRRGWGDHGVEKKLGETSSAHNAKVAIATELYINSPEGINLRPEKKRTVLKWGLHDLAEWKAPDYTPHDVANGIITVEQKKEGEFEALRTFGKDYGDYLPLELFHELENDANAPENRLIHELDKLDTGVMALNYQARWYDTEEFLPYTQKKLSDPFLKEAFEWLLKKEFPELDYFYQYCSFLYLHGDVEKVREFLNESRG